MNGKIRLLCGVLAVFLAGCYVTRQSLRQNDLYNTRVKIDDLLANPATSAQVKDRLVVTRRILNFASRHGLNTDGAYLYYIPMKEPVVSYLVQAAHVDRLESYTWWFPVVGRVPYLGFFAKQERDEEATRLAAQGFDVHKSGAGAFSSLGWFDDPLFSSMLSRSDADLAHLLLHELTHRTFWAPGSTKFNENLAEYSGIELAKLYLAESGTDQEMKRFTGKLEDKQLFKTWLDALKKDLEALYEQRSTRPLGEILAKKETTFARYLNPPVRPAFKATDYIKADAWNNATVLAAGLYAPDTRAFAKAHACLRRPKMIDFLNALKALTDSGVEPFAALEKMCG